ncbi:MAG TPA: DUF4139 domain-containing protein, partial [Myxococcaceae bacterium]|nr:DUF4139 domain-containing protein [Myxococcaceae bacterium]
PMPSAVAPSAPRAAPPSRAFESMEESGEVASADGYMTTPPAEAFSLAPPPGYSPPAVNPDMPAALAGGYDLSYPSLRPETLRSGQGARRVALFIESWPVTVERKVFPALAPEAAFLVAELKSPASQMLPGGEAHLFVGQDPTGTARLKLVAPGEPFTLPLGLDRAIKPIHNVKLVQSERGLIGQDEVTEYVVTNELANPYPFPLQVRIFDQWPLAADKDTEVLLLKTEPYALQDKVTGALEWRLSVPPKQKAVVSFTYSLRRPKGWRLHQQ